MKRLLQKLVGDPNVKALRGIEPLVAQICELEKKYQKLTDKQLSAQTSAFKKQLKDGTKLDDILPDAFAAVRETATRTLGQRHFDVQLMGGVVLHQGNIAEMKTGEGKTLVATLPVYLNALTEKGVHVVTVNDYLARRDAGWMGQIYHALGMSVSVIASGNNAFIYDPDYTDDSHDDVRLRHLRPVEKPEAYKADITYGTNNEFGFDYLRDNMRGSLEELAQRGLAYAIIDEVDSILIDEARTPLIISAPSVESGDTYQQFATLARQLDKDAHYAVDEKANSASLTDDGVVKVQKALGMDNLFDTEHVQAVYHMEQALKAQALFTLDRDYVVRDGEVIIVDQFTGRLMPGRRYSEGLHQAIEAKEGVKVLQESMTLATISFQNYFRLYDKLAGMTGTAKTEEEEFQDIYNLDVIVVPTNRPMVRRDLHDRIYKTMEAKYRAIVDDVKTRHEQGQPVLIGTVSIEKNEMLSKLLAEAKVPHEILNAKNNESEAAIVERAGQRGAVTLATNIAGRGTDIVLGEGVVDLGGLHVVGSERHESRRIDNQLRGRTGRQGDPGSSQFYVALDDDLMRIFGGERIASVMNTLRIDENIPIENPMISRAIEGAQKKVESHHFDVRKQVLQYDDVMNRHRLATYSRRREALKSQSLKSEILDMVKATISSIIQAHHSAETGDIAKDKVLDVVKTMMPLSEQEITRLAKAKDKDLETKLIAVASGLYKQKEKDFGADTLRGIERWLYLSTLDRLWMEHLENMEHMREGIHLQAVGQRDPLVEYKRQAHDMFNELNVTLDREIASTFFKLVPRAEVREEEVETELTQAAEQARITRGKSEDDASAKPQTVRKQQKIGRNDPCPCGSGLKYKKCGLINAPEHKG